MTLRPEIHKFSKNLEAYQVFTEEEYYFHNMLPLKNVKMSQNENMLLQNPLYCIITLDMRCVFDAPKFDSLVSRPNCIPGAIFEQRITG
jgi:hypothetical protein